MTRRTTATYDFSRLGFRADVIEPLRDDDLFAVVTPEGTFRMSKREFYRDFANVVRTMSYRVRGLYHYPVTPQKAIKYLLTRDQRFALTKRRPGRVFR